MKHFLLLLFLLPTIAFGQTTAIPDANFEQALIDLGYDTGTPDGSVPTANINSVTSLNVYSKSISDLTGIEDFAALIHLELHYNQLTSLDISNNSALAYLNCTNQYIDLGGNYTYTLTSLDVSNNSALIELHCMWNQLTTLDVSNNTNLEILSCHINSLTSLNVNGAASLTELYCSNNQLTTLDVSQNTNLEKLICYANQLTCLNVKNGNNGNLIPVFSVYNNPNLTCIEVDDAAWSTANWTDIDSIASFSTNCNYPINCGSGTTGIPESPTKPKDLLYITDILGRTTYPVPNRLLFYIYDDGSVEKKIRLER